jgi:type IV fimbrial biogenesis protein FimT
MTRIADMNFSQYSVNGDRLRARLQQGLTLIEMMVVISILGILLAIATPSFSEALLSSKLRSYANNLVASVHLARSEAIKNNAVVRLCASNNGTSCTGDWQNGWIVIKADDTVIESQQATSDGYLITEAGGKNTLNFQSTGIGSTQATLTICRATPYLGNQERLVSISATGKPSTTKTTVGACS